MAGLAQGRICGDLTAGQLLRGHQPALSHSSSSASRHTLRLSGSRQCALAPATGSSISAHAPRGWAASRADVTDGGQGRGRGRASWICHAAGPLVRRPPLRLQGRGAERAGDPVGQAELDVADAADLDSPGLLPGVARVQCVQDLPRFDLPLLLGSFRSSVCNAVAVSYCGQSYLLAPAASVVYGSQVRVLLPGREKPFPAQLQHLGLECELAVLAVESSEFWEAIVPYDLAPYDLAQLQQQVSVISYAEGQPGPRSAPGTVMRTEVVTYPSAMQRLLGMTVAVALSKDQLGSAVVDSRGRCLGVVFGRTVGSGGGNKRAGGAGGGGGAGAGAGERWGQGRRRVARRRGRRGQTEASATVVPVPVVAHFLEDIRRHGRYLGFPTLGIQWKRTESAALRRYSAMTEAQTGVVITSLNPTAALAAHAQPLDLLSAVGEAAVGNDGTVAFRGGEDSIHISYHISQFQVGEQVDLTLLRGGQLLQASITLGVPHRLLPLHLNGRPPQYLVVSGLVLTVLSAPFLEGAFGRTWATRAPVQLLREWHNHPSTEDEQVVVVAECQDMGPGSATDGYDRRGVLYQRVVRCNGVPVTNLSHLVALVAEATAIATATAATAQRRGSALRGRSLPASAAGLAAAASAASVQSAETAESAESAEPAAEESGGQAETGTRGDSAQQVDESVSDSSEEADAAVVSAAPSASDSAAAAAEAVGGAAEARGGGGGGSGPPPDPRNLVLELSSRMLLVIPLRRARDDTREMLAEYEVQHAVSEDLRPVYEAGLRLGRGTWAGASAGKAGGGAGSRGGRGGAGRTTRSAAGEGETG